MKKPLYIILLLIFTLIMPVNTYAAFPETYQLGLSTSYINQVTGYREDPEYPDKTGTKYTYEYREFPFHPKRTVKEKPTAQFAVYVNGEKRVVSDADDNLDAPTTVCDVNIDDKVEINPDLSKAYPGNTINLYDFQYRILPTSDDEVDLYNINDYRQQFKIIYKNLKSAKDVNKHFQNNTWKDVKEMSAKYPDRDIYVELYLQVQDYNPKNKTVGDGSNGTYATIRTKEQASHFLKGNTWYFTTVLLRVNTKGAPDFFPTPEGSTEWKPQYKDPKYCAKTYTYEQGQTEITFPVNLFNQGEEAITDFKAVWFNSSKVNPKPWDSPVWQNDNEISIAKGESQTFEVTVPLPVPDYAEGMLAFKCNVNGKTPANETNQENNMMIIKIQEAGVDIEAKLPDTPSVYLIDPGQTANVTVPLIVRRNDEGTEPVDTDINYSGPFGSENKQATFTSINSNYYDIKFSLTQPGKYYVKASAWPVGVTDIKPENNEDQCLIVVKFKNPPKEQPTKTDSDSNTRVNLRS